MCVCVAYTLGVWDEFFLFKKKKKKKTQSNSIELKFRKRKPTVRGAWISKYPDIMQMSTDNAIGRMLCACPRAVRQWHATAARAPPPWHGPTHKKRITPASPRVLNVPTPWQRETSPSIGCPQGWAVSIGPWTHIRLSVIFHWNFIQMIKTFVRSTRLRHERHFFVKKLFLKIFLNFFCKLVLESTRID